MSIGKLIETKKKMTIDSHGKGSKGSHSRGKENAKANGIRKRMSEEEFD